MKAEQGDTFRDQFPHMHAALKAAESVRPGNELQETAAADIMRLAFDMEVRRAFPDTPDTAETDLPAATE